MKITVKEIKFNLMKFKEPLEIAENTFWVGGWLPGDQFQCHTYLLREGENSVLFDPGSLLSYPQTIEKIKKLINPEDVKYFVCHHQDPDITACISTYEKEFPRKDRVVVTHWRTQVLLKHYAWQSKFYLVEKNKWQLKLPSGRVLKFIFTPYVHFAGAICTYDPQTKVLFSSDLFGALVSQNKLFAEEEKDFEDIKLFHEHYMPSKEALFYAIQKIKSLDLELIAPQHGYIIPKKLIPLFIQKLSKIECGIFLLVSEVQDLLHLSRVNQLLNALMDIFLEHQSFKQILKEIYHRLRSVIPLLDFYVIALQENAIILYESSGEKTYIENSQSLKWVKNLKNSLKNKEFKIAKTLIPEILEKRNPKDYKFYIFPLKIEKTIIGFFILVFPPNKFKLSQINRKLFEKLGHILSWYLEKELKFLNLKKEKEELYDLAVKDRLTGAYNRFFLEIKLKELEKEIARYKIPVSIILIDVDYFKEINDKYGHLVGDEVLKRIVKIFIENLRNTDTIIRYGGEEFLIFLPHTTLSKACQIAERLRKTVENTVFEIDGHRIKVTISAGVVSTKNQNKRKKSLKSLIKKADSLLYFAKKKGRNQVICEG